MDIGKGPFEVYYQGQLINGIESVDFTTDEETTDISTIQGQKVTISQSYSAEVVLTFVDTGINNLKRIVPSAWIADGELVNGQPAGTLVTGDDGAIALGNAGSEEEELQGNLQFVPATGSGQHTITMFDGVATLSDLSVEDQVIKAEVTVRSNAVGVQILKGGVTLVS